MPLSEPLCDLLKPCSPAILQSHKVFQRMQVEGGLKVGYTGRAHQKPDV